MSSNESLLDDHLLAAGQMSSLLTVKQRILFETINYSIITVIIVVFGVFGNILNLIVFYKQKFTNTLNISLFAISISDLGSLITLLFNALCVNPLFEEANIPFVPREVNLLVSGLPHNCFNRITSWITVFITTERCVSFTTPFKVKQIISPRKTFYVLCTIFVTAMLSFSPRYFVSYLDWKLYPWRNKTLVGLINRVNEEDANIPTFILSPVLEIASLFIVIAFTAVLAILLRRRSTNWKKQATSEMTRSETMLTREKRTARLVIAVALVVIVCYMPATILTLTQLIEPKFRPRSLEYNLYYAVWSFAVMFQALNASINVILYHGMSTKYRETFQQLLPGCCKRSSSTIEDMS